MFAGVVALGCFLAGSAQAAPGGLDPGFGSAGKVVTVLGGSARGVAIQSDGRIVVAGAANNRFGVARYMSDGSLDASFGSGGIVTTQVGGFMESANALALQPDGKIVAAGGSAPDGYCCQFALARYNPDGSLDPSFSADGRVTTLFGGDAEAFAVALQFDGKIVAAGMKDDPFESDLALARYNTDGSLDTSFGVAGQVTTNVGGYGTSLAIQSDGKIIAAGAAGGDFLLARYTTSGQLDTGFGTAGTVGTDFGGQSDAANAATVQSDGKIVIAGVGGERFALARYNSDGSIDSGFGSGGKVTTSFFGENIETANALAIQQNDKIVAGGRAFSDFDPSYALARYNPDGSLDASFGSNGKVTTDFGNPADVGVLCPPARKDCSEDSANGLAIQSDGKIIAVGGGGASVPANQWTLARYLGDPTVTTVTIDIKPGSTDNPINLSSRGAIPVAILSADGFDATTVEASTVCFGDDNNPSQRDCTAAHGGHTEDVNADGRPDLVLQFETQETGIDPGDTTACLTGKTLAGIDIQGCDTINVH